MNTKPVLLALLAALLIASGCQRTQQPTAPEKPVRGGTLVIGTDEVPEALNPAIESGGPNLRWSTLIYQGLLFTDEDLKLQPELAENFEVEDGGATYRFRLRDNVKWHDGQPFTSADVKFTVEEILVEFHPRVRTALRSKLEAIETPDPQTVVFRLKAPFAPFPEMMTVSDAPILPKHVFEGRDPTTHPANLQPVGTGPFKFVSLEKESELRLARNPDYFRDGLPYLDTIVIREIPDAANLFQTLEKGDLDIARPRNLTPDLKRLSSDDRFQVVKTSFDTSGGNCVDQIGFNLDRPMFGDARVRRAIAHGLDRKRIIDEITFGYGRVADAPIASGITWAHAKDVDLPDFDPSRAAALLTEAGWIEGPDGKRVAKDVSGISDGTAFRFEYFGSGDEVKLGELMRDQLADLGVEVVVTRLQTDLLDTRVFEKRDFDTYRNLICQRTDPEIGYRRVVHSSAILPIGRTNGAGYRNAEVDRLWDQASQEPDLDERGELYREAQGILARDMPYIWLYEQKSVWVQAKSCAGIQHGSGRLVESAYCRS